VCFGAARFPDVEIQRCASLALACILVGPEMTTKMSIMADDGLLPLLALCACSDVECERAATFALGCLAECPDVKSKVVELGGTITLVQQGRADDLEVRRNCGYFLALLAEEVRVKLCCYGPFGHPLQSRLFMVAVVCVRVSPPRSNTTMTWCGRVG
jgi:hypothetical protein